MILWEASSSREARRTSSTNCRNNLRFNLELAEEKTRLLIFGRFAAVERRNRESYYLLSSTSFEGCSGVKIDLTQDCRDGHSHIKWIGIQ